MEEFEFSEAFSVLDDIIDSYEAYTPRAEDVE